MSLTVGRSVRGVTVLVVLRGYMRDAGSVIDIAGCDSAVAPYDVDRHALPAHEHTATIAQLDPLLDTHGAVVAYAESRGSVPTPGTMTLSTLHHVIMNEPPQVTIVGELRLQQTQIDQARPFGRLLTRDRRLRTRDLLQAEGLLI